MGWLWHRTRRTDPARVDRHGLVLAVATLLSVAYGTRHEQARARGLPLTGVFAQNIAQLKGLF